MTSLLRRQQIVNAALVGTALALVVVVFATRDRMTTTEAEARGDNLFQTYAEGDITRIRFERKEGSFTLSRAKVEDGGEASFNLTEPVKEEAEAFGIQKILGTFEFASAIRHIKPEEVNRAAMGLDDPGLVIHVDMGSIKYRLRLGSEAASPPGAHYLEIAGESAPGKSVVLISKNLANELSAKLDDFRERYVMPYLSSSLDKFEVEGTGGTRKLRRGDWHDGWRFDGMLGDVRAGRAALDRLLVQFARTRAVSFLEPDVAEKALATGDRVKVTMTPSNKKDAVGVVEIGGKCPSSDNEVVALRRSPERLAACVPRTVLSGLTTPADALVDRTLFWMRPDEVEGFDVTRGDRHLALERKESGFVLRAPHEGTVDAEAGNARLDAILHATGRIVEAPDKKKLGLDPPQGNVATKSVAANEDKVREEAVALSAPLPDGRVYAERRQDGAVLELGRDAARALSADASLVRSRTLLDLPIADVTRVEVDGALRQVVERAPSGVLRLLSPSGFEIDSPLGLELCDALRGLSAERWVADENDGTFGLETPTLTAKLVTEKGDQKTEHVLRVGRPAASGYYADLAEGAAGKSMGGVFVVSKRLYETLTTLVLDRSVLAADPATTVKITLEAPSRTVVLEKVGDEFLETDPGEPLSEGAVRRITDTLTALRAESAIAVGPPRGEQGFDKPLLTVRIEREPGHEDKARQTVWRVGAGDSYRGVSVHYVRVDGVPATYAVARSNVRALLDPL